MSLRSYTLYQLLKSVPIFDTSRTRTSSTTDGPYHQDLISTPLSSCMPRTIGFKSAPMLAILAIFGVLICACKNDTEGPEEPTFVPGEVIVGLKPDVDYDEAKSLLNIPETTIRSLNYDLTVYLISGKPDSIKSLLENSPYIELGIVQPQTIINDKYYTPIWLMTKGVASKEYFTKLFSSFSELDNKIKYSPFFAEILVPEGREIEFVELFKKLSPKIAYANVNGYYKPS